MVFFTASSLRHAKRNPGTCNFAGGMSKQIWVDVWAKHKVLNCFRTFFIKTPDLFLSSV
jgi:hypothetical protein